MKVIAHFVFLLCLYFYSLSSVALTIVALNTQWFWDDELPHEGNVIKDFDDVFLNKYFVNMKAYGIAQLINSSNADLVALSEIENKQALERIKEYLPEPWQIIFDQGRDSYTGQDVAFLSRIAMIDKSVTNFPDITGKYQDTSKRPSKILGAGFMYQGESYYFITAHLLSKRKDNPAKTKRRAAQANALYQAAMRHINIYDHVVVLGDFNDDPNSAVLNEIKGEHTNLPILFQTADISDTEMYSIKKYKKLIDHILVSKSLESSCDRLKTIKTGPLSDHLAVSVTCK